ncbi:MAG: large-conductance mechanosensitive channel [Bacteroidetes bacterium GWF2_49_14]|nr:MAG: large-conductance mechanosensitive channel [Bacteroidetes bacterium GWF2_49_14]HBB91594.1 large conductance mechanosensitive channel protein MscL [Bacteroidales bacterium]
MGLMKDFKNFAMKGNVLDLATAVIIGAAFGKIISSLVNDLLMPPLGLLLGKVDFKDLKIILTKGVDGAADVTLNYGMFVQNVFDFLIIAFCIFMIIRAAQKLEKKKLEAPAAPPAPTKEVQLLEEIRDLLKK